jgi:hypothetical protein
MSGRNRLPSGEPRRASQRPPARQPRKPPSRLKFRGTQATGCAGGTAPAPIDATPATGKHVEIIIAERVYRVRRAELRPG